MRKIKVRIGLTNLFNIYNSNKTFFMYKLNEDETRIIDYVLTDDLARFRNRFDNNFKLVDDIKKQIENFKIIL